MGQEQPGRTAVRVIAGKYRSRILQAPRGTRTRPTSDRLRETLFNVLHTRMEGCRFADLYAGSGAVGIEAISRGAAEVFFAEKEASALVAIRDNLRALGITAAAHIEAGGTAALLKKLAAKKTGLDVIFLDPPYEDAEAYTRTLHSLGEGITVLLAPDAIVVAEHSRKLSLGASYGALHRIRVLEQGDAALSFFSAADGGSTLTVTTTGKLTGAQV